MVDVVDSHSRREVVVHTLENGPVVLVDWQFPMPFDNLVVGYWYSPMRLANAKELDAINDERDQWQSCDCFVDVCETRLGPQK